MSLWSSGSTSVPEWRRTPSRKARRERLDHGARRGLLPVSDPSPFLDARQWYSLRLHDDDAWKGFACG
jgi:hypothetical protein